MRLALFLLFLAVALATASAPAVAQLTPTAEVEKPVKEKKDKAKKPVKETKKDNAKKLAKGDEEGGDDDENGVDDEDGDDEEAGEAEEGETGGGSGGGGSGDDSGPGVQDPAGPERSTKGSGSADNGEGDRSSSLGEAGCSEGCDSIRDSSDGGEGDEVLSRTRPVGRDGRGSGLPGSRGSGRRVPGRGRCTRPVGSLGREPGRPRPVCPGVARHVCRSRWRPESASRPPQKRLRQARTPQGDLLSPLGVAPRPRAGRHLGTSGANIVRDLARLRLRPLPSCARLRERHRGSVRCELPSSRRARGSPGAVPAPL